MQSLIKISRDGLPLTLVFHSLSFELTDFLQRVFDMRVNHH